MKKYIMLIVVCLTCLFSASANGQNLTDSKQIMLQTIDKVESVNAMSYSGSVYQMHDGIRLKRVSGQIKYAKAPEIRESTMMGLPVMFKIEANIPTGESTNNEMEVINNETGLMIKDNQHKTILKLSTQYAAGMLAGEMIQLLPGTLYNEEVLSEDLDANWEFAGIKDSDGVSCYVLKLQTEDKLGDAIYPIQKELHIGTDDFLIRKIVFNSLITEIKDIKTFTSLPPANFEFQNVDAFVFTTFDMAKDRHPMAESRLLPSGTQAPYWELQDLNDKLITSNQYKGKVLLIDFWATWCGPCKAAVPVLNELYDKYKDRGLEVIGINAREEITNKEYIIQHGKKTGYQYPILLNGDPVADDYHVFGLPTFYIVDRDGGIVYADYGAPPTLQTKLEQIIVEILNRQR